MEPKKPNSPLKDNASGNYFYPVTTIDQIIVDNDTRLNDYSIIKIKEFSSILLASGWIRADAKYTQQITVEGLNDAYEVDVKPMYSGNFDTDLQINQAIGCVSYATQDKNKITFYCLKNKPEFDIPIEMEVHI